MGNCQAVDAAALVIQYPSGKTERKYWSVSASEVMKMNPGHYVSLIIPCPADEKKEDNTVRFTRVKLLRSSDTLVLGQAYRLVTTEEVMKVLRAKNYEKTRRNQAHSDDKSRIHPAKKNSICEAQARKPDLEKTSQSMRQESYRQRPAPTKFAMARSKSWCPSLQSISEGRS